MKIIQYEPSCREVWDKFLKQSKNGHFMFNRGYMEYHSDRFTDHSMLIYDDNDRLFALIPASISGDKICSHGGLSFGRVVLPAKSAVSKVTEIFDLLISYFKSINISVFEYKRMPDIYTAIPSQEDLYALFRHDARLIGRELNSVIDLSSKYSYSKGRRWSVKKSGKLNLELDVDPMISEYWSLLERVLLDQHGTCPVHSVEEIILLKNIFPDNIKIHTVSYEGEVVAGVLMFVNEGVAHTQYMANSLKGRELAALDFLIDHLISVEYKNKKYFSFGISTEKYGKYLNTGLAAQKEGFGAQSIVHDCYQVDVK